VKAAALRQILGLLSGAALIAAGAAEITIMRAGYENPKVQPFCQAGLCADQFSPEHVFDLSQKAALGNPRGQLEDFKRGVRLSPSSAYRWADLAEAEFNVRDYALAEYAISRALDAGPRSPVVLLRAANLDFQIGNGEHMLRNLSALLSDPFLADYYDAAFLAYSRVGLPIDQILRSLPQQTAAFSKLLTFWTKVGKVDEAVATWKWASTRSLADSQSSYDFFTFMIRAGQSASAQQLWQQQAQRQEPAYRKTNWIYNPGFEQLPLQSPFDWTIDTHPDVEASRVQDAGGNGASALQLRFHGEVNTDYQGSFQDMVLEPGRYKFSFRMKTEQITTDEGVRIHIFDQPTQAKLNIWTDTATGTQNWKQIETSFDVPPGLQVVRVTVDRKPSGMFDNKIGGTAWINDLKLSRQ